MNGQYKPTERDGSTLKHLAPVVTCGDIACGASNSRKLLSETNERPRNQHGDSNKTRKGGNWTDERARTEWVVLAGFPPKRLSGQAPNFRLIASKIQSEIEGEITKSCSHQVDDVMTSLIKTRAIYKKESCLSRDLLNLLVFPNARAGEDSPGKTPSLKYGNRSALTARLLALPRERRGAIKGGGIK